MTFPRAHRKNTFINKWLLKARLHILPAASDSRVIIIHRAVWVCTPLENLPLTNSSRTFLTGWVQTAAVQSLQAQTLNANLAQPQICLSNHWSGEKSAQEREGFSDLLFYFFQINAEESFFCGIGRRNAGGSRLVDGILAVKREQYTKQRRWWNEMLMSLKL